jgi:hypothetical protein
MKKLIILSAVIVSALAGCKTQQQASTVINDDVYTSPKHYTKVVPQKTSDIDLSAPQQISTPDSSSRAKSGSATWYDEYSGSKSGGQDVSGEQGSASNPESYVDPNLYDNTYSSDPDVNVYVGSSYDPFFWGSSVSIGCGFGWGSYYWGYPYYNWYYPYYGYYPYSYWGWGGGYSYWNGYWDGYNDGYWNGHHWWNDDSHSGSSYYYGQRRMLTSGNDRTHFGTGRIVNPESFTTGRVTPRTIEDQRNSKSNDRTAGTRSINQQGTERITPSQEKIRSTERIKSEVTTRNDGNKVSPERQRYQYERIKKEPTPAVNPRNGNGARDIRPKTQREQPVPKYSRTEVRTQSNRTVETQNYTSPAYKQPKYSQEYINPRSQGSTNTGIRESGQTRKSTPTVTGSQNRNYSTPSSSGRKIGTPSNTNNTRTYSTPSRSHSSPSISSPSRSSGSSGTHSGGNYSAPSRSSGSSGNSGSHSGGGGGRRK